MEIKNHILQGIEYIPSPNRGKILVNPKLIVIHYDASNTQDQTIDWLTNKKSKVSAHISIGRNGNIIQMVPFNVISWHAGVSEWRDIKHVNNFSIGIELQNKGNEEYTGQQLNSLYHLCKSLLKEYGIQEVVGHNDISADRKIDPVGIKRDLFDWRIFNMSVGLEVKQLKTTSNLNLRIWNDVKWFSLTVIPKDTFVYEINRVGDWSKVQYGKLSGWVNNKYLR